MFSYDSSKNEFLTKDTIREIAPSVFTEKADSSSTSKHYVHIPTENVIDDMASLGWGVVDAKQVNARKNAGYQKHMVVFGNDDITITGKDGDTVMPRILMTNSHDGKNAFTFTAGLFRMICENGLVVADTKFEDFKVKHMGYDFETLQDTIKEIISNLDLTVVSMNKMKETELNEEQMFNLAKSVLAMRVEGTNNTYNKDAITEVLDPQRSEDVGNGLWEVFNRVQENIMEGNFEYLTVKGKPRQARIIKNFKQDQDLNKKMFSKALEFVA